jgi:hypothetical protein
MLELNNPSDYPLLRPYKLNPDKYFVSECGRVFSFGRHGVFAEIKSSLDTRGYPIVGVYVDGVRKTVKVHKMVLETWVSDRPEGLEAAHLDGNKQNNHVSNLIWCTHIENMSHQKLHGTSGIQRVLQGEKHRDAKYTSEIVLKLRSDYEAGITIAALSRIYNINYKTVQSIVKRKTWRHI